MAKLLQFSFLFFVVTAKPINDLNGCDKYGNDECGADSMPVRFPGPSRRPMPRELCELCDLAMPVIRSLVHKNQTEHFENIAVFFCNEFKIVDPVVCSYAIMQ